ncbi:MAG: UDP-N-acetylmuramate dehydrogenase [Gammaproteobacteria bacterium]
MAAEKTQHWRGEMKYDEPMEGHTSWRAGGCARRFYKPADIDDLSRFLAGLDPAEPLLWLGLGSNLLVRDGGFPGTVIITFGALMEMHWIDEQTVRVGAGMTCSKVARTTARKDLTGAEFLAGIPGTMGGALAMNAGAFEGETWAHVTAVETIDRAGRVHTRLPSAYRVAYRSVAGVADEWFLAATLALQHGDAAAALQRIQGLLARRSATQPTQQPSCGSVFRNPPGDFAARLIEASGLKGLTRGGAQVSEKHANFIINSGAATATDIEALIIEVQDRVEQAQGVRLKTEVRIVGEQTAQ